MSAKLRALLAVTLSASFWSCTTTKFPADVQFELDRRAGTVEGNVSPLPKPILIDLRDPRAKGDKVLSAWIGDCTNAVERKGDNTVASDRSARLQRDLVEALGHDNAGSTLEVQRYDIYVNAEARITGQAWAVASASVGAYGAGGSPEPRSTNVQIRPKCDKDKMEGGWFDPADLTNNVSPITVEIAFLIDGKYFKTSAAYSPLIDLYSPPSKDVLAAYVQDAMKKANARAAETVKASK